VKDVNENELCIVKGRLCNATGVTQSPFRKSSFVLYSLCVVEKRGDIEELPFYPLFQKALRSAASREEGSWDRAKAALNTVCSAQT
jgi:hypothetical protein